MKPIDRRKRLFSSGKPVIRRFEEKDSAWIWADYRKGGGEASKQDFLKRLNEQLSPYNDLYVIEDANKEASPIGIVGAKFNGWLFEPHVEWFSWATKRNILRGAVSFLQKFRYQDVGIIRVHALESDKEFFFKLKQYVPLYYRGKIPHGDEFGRGTDYIFSMRGNKKL